MSSTSKYSGMSEQQIVSLREKYQKRLNNWPFNYLFIFLPLFYVLSVVALNIVESTYSFTYLLVPAFMIAMMLWTVALFIAVPYTYWVCAKTNSLMDAEDVFKKQRGEVKPWYLANRYRMM